MEMSEKTIKKFEIIFATIISCAFSEAFKASIVSKSNSRITVTEHARIEEKRVTRMKI